MIIRAVKLQMSIRRSMILRKLTALLPIRSVLRNRSQWGYDSNLIGVVLPIGVVIFFMVMMMRQNGGGGGKMMDFGKSRAKLANQMVRK